MSLCGGQSEFKKEATILKRLVKKFGSQEVEYMLKGAHALGWTSLRGLSGPEGIGRQWALQKYWASVNRKAQPLPDSVKDVLRKMLV